MKKYVKRQLLEKIDAMKALHGEVIDAVKGKQSDRVLALLTDCQEAAIHIGTVIDASEGEGLEEVRELEHYCEIVWQYSEQSKTDAAFDSREFDRQLKKSLIYVANGIRNRIPVHREIVFLPYKASMWDSFETVWKKLVEEENTRVYVIPIPYYDKDAKGHLCGIHHEIDDFPSEVPVTHYRDYDLAKEHPDRIYIHNPYDETNLVTSVHPNFYSSRLKDYTDELVYIPYFVLGDIDPSDHQMVKKMAYHVTVPAVINAHKVIVQSEAWRTVYIDVMTQLTGKESRAYWERKIDGSGSPKLERVTQLKSSDFVLPKEWEKVVMTQDGIRKKIIIYNTTIGAFLKHDEGMLAKMESVLGIFREKTDTVTLLWRPHPLYEATIKSMRPHLWEKYKRIVDGYRKEGWGIYDESAELDRAIAISDAYYGDMSSVVWLYRATGKPVLIQNVEMEKAK